MIGGSNSYGDLLLVLGKFSRSDGFSKKSDIALTGVMKLRSKDEVLFSTFVFFLAKRNSRTNTKDGMKTLIRIADN